MSIKIGNDKISKIFAGSDHIVKVFEGFDLIFSEDGLSKFTDVPVNGYLTMDDDYIYLSRGVISSGDGSGNIAAYPQVYKINKQTKESTKIIEVTSDVNENVYTKNNVRTESNGSLVLIIFGNGDYYMWYNKVTGACSDIYNLDTSVTEETSSNIRGGVIDEAYTYIIGTTYVYKIDNNTKEMQIKMSGTNQRSAIDDNNYIYIFDKDVICYLFDKAKNNSYVMIEPPSEVYDGIWTSARQITICQNNSYVFKICQTTGFGTSKILVINKNNQTASLTASITEIQQSSSNVGIACNDSHLFVTNGSKIYIFDLEQNDLTNYTTVDLSKYIESIDNAVADNKYLYICAGSAIYRYTV